MRQVILDTETTGLEPKLGHRIIEIGGVEVVNRRITGNHFQRYLNPEREIDEAALEVHGISRESLNDKPRFVEIAEALIEFIRGAEVIMHNADFDIGFLDHEFSRAGPEWGRTSDYCTVLDTLALARKMHPGQRNSLDALCKRYAVDNTSRTLHGALLDAEILADVYLAMTGGQISLLTEASLLPAADPTVLEFDQPAMKRRPVRVVQASAEECQAHGQWLALLEEKSGGRCLWRELNE